jgi:hypothetical protein
MIRRFFKAGAGSQPVIFEIVEVIDFRTGRSPHGGSSQPLPKRG